MEHVFQSGKISGSPRRCGKIVKLTHISISMARHIRRDSVSVNSSPHHQPLPFLGQPHSKSGLQSQLQMTHPPSIKVFPWKIRATLSLQGLCPKLNCILLSPHWLAPQQYICFLDCVEAKALKFIGISWDKDKAQGLLLSHHRQVGILSYLQHLPQYCSLWCHLTIHSNSMMHVYFQKPPYGYIVKIQAD